MRFSRGSVVVEYEAEAVANSTQDAAVIVDEVMNMAIETGEGLPDNYTIESSAVTSRNIFLYSNSWPISIQRLR